MIKIQRQAFSIVEVLIALAIVSLAILPLMTLSQSNNYSTIFNERYLIGLCLGKRISTELEMMGYKKLSQNSELSSEGTSCTIANPLLKIKPIGQGLIAPSITESHQKKMSKYGSTLLLKMHERGFLSVETEVNWTIPGETRSMKRHNCKLVTFIVDGQNASTFNMKI